MVNSNKPLVSIVIPCYNHEDYVKDCIKSIISQTYKNIELIIIDDGSSDNSVKRIQELINECQKRFIRFEFRTRPNKGLSATLNEALEWCKGKYFSPIASDDLMLPQKTEIQVDYLENNLQCVGVFGEIHIKSNNPRIIKLKAFKEYAFNDIFLHNHHLPTATQMLRKESIEITGGYNSKILLEDWYMNLKLTENGDTLHYIPQYLAQYRRHNNNISSKTELLHDGRLDILSKYKNHPLYTQAKSKAYLVTANSLQLTNKKASLKYFIQYLELSPKNIITKFSFKYLLKFFIPYKFLKIHFGGNT